jgi:hypothetical protein
MVEQEATPYQVWNLRGLNIRTWRRGVLRAKKLTG